MSTLEREIIVVGGSAGAIEALITLVRALPADLPASVFVVIHTPPNAMSRLPEILGRAGQLPAGHGRAGEKTETGRISVAPPDQHLLVRPGRIELMRGPRENHSRPAIDPLFRSAARVYGPRVIGVLLSGALSDGAAGLLAVKARGGLVMIQDPAEAIVSSMPRNALELVEADHVLPAARIGSEIVQLVRQSVLIRRSVPVPRRPRLRDRHPAGPESGRGENRALGLRAFAAGTGDAEPADSDEDAGARPTRAGRAVRGTGGPVRAPRGAHPRIAGARTHARRR